MIKTIIFGLTLTFLISCQKEEKKLTTNSTLQASTRGSSMKQDNFDEFKKKEDESCEDEEALKKKLIPEKPKAFQLQGGDAGCDIEALHKK